MFEHLDDPAPPDLGATFHGRVVTTGRRRRRRVRLALGSAVLCPALAAGAFGLYLRDQAGELQRISVDGLAPASAPPMQSPSDTTPPASTAEPHAEPSDVPPIATPLNILVTGVDRRPPGDAVPGSRADTIAVIRIDPISDRVAVLAIPRDLYVEHDGTAGRINRFTAETGIVSAVSSLLAIDVNHYVEVDFAGFESLIDLVGGVPVPFDTAVRDVASGFTAEPGCQELNGSEALAYVRSRRLESLDAATGQWTTDQRSDLGRIARQQDLMQRVYRAVLSADYGVADQIRLVTDVVDDLTVDDGLDVTGLRAIFNAAEAIGADNVEFYDLNAGLRATVVGDAQVLIVDDDTLGSAVGGLLGDAPPTVTPDRATPPDDAIAPTSSVC